MKKILKKINEVVLVGILLSMLTYCAYGGQSSNNGNSDLYDFESMQIDAQNYEELMEDIGNWDDFASSAIIGQIVKEIIKGEIVNEFVQRSKDLAESAKREYDSYRDSRERSESPRDREGRERAERLEQGERNSERFKDWC